MGIKNLYDGYKSFSYLRAGIDYEHFEPALWNWVGERRIPLEPEEEARVTELAESSIYIALHEHPTLFPRNIDQTMACNRAGRQDTAYEGLSHSYIDCVFDNLMDGTCVISSKAGWKWGDVIHDLGMRLCDIAHQNFLFPCRTAKDIRKAFRQGRIAWVPVLEGAAPIENEIDRIDILYGLGIRQMGVTYSEANALGSGLKEQRDGGLTVFGKRCIERMNRVGMLIDISHCGPQTAMEAVELSEKPIIASHTGARGLWDIKRLFSDELIQAIAKKGGVIGVEAAPHTTMTATRGTHDVYSVMEHFEYMVKLVGIDHVAFGVDALYGDHVGLHRVFAANLSKSEMTGGGQAHGEVDYVWGMENPTEASWNILRYLVKKGYSDEDIKKVLGCNAMRVLEEVWA